jgi:hypothetical protein
MAIHASEKTRKMLDHNVWLRLIWVSCEVEVAFVACKLDRGSKWENVGSGWATPWPGGITEARIGAGRVKIPRCQRTSEIASGICT